MKIINYSILFGITLVLTGCPGLFDSGSEKIIGRYQVLWIDVWENQKISKQDKEHPSGSSVLVPEYVYAVGHNDEYIIAKQHPTSGFEKGYKVDTSITNYYMIQMNEEEEYKDLVFGPLTIHQFDSIRREKGIESLEFDMNYPDNGSSIPPDFW